MALELLLAALVPLLLALLALLPIGTASAELERALLVSLALMRLEIVGVYFSEPGQTLRSQLVQLLLAPATIQITLNRALVFDVQTKPAHSFQLLLLKCFFGLNAESLCSLLQALSVRVGVLHAEAERPLHNLLLVGGHARESLGR